ncbi:uncharacterized protein Ecym_4304 [Eremothecium cymbalariae DBVPG|uniref:Genetic interactor of prohibitin 5, mitochondrial n=1 Tax=Eremothecium cymbalariae (strain CBS 270.75 / DBVPG 7215 / KCTC 17166 / NRRL Y-17582) TaxID=931890 RepID=G8JTL4_ERECY|nr:hypothetical protein Ecym_4304 [Eremothecium cymbalariae DBVPG\
MGGMNRKVLEIVSRLPLHAHTKKVIADNVGSVGKGEFKRVDVIEPINRYLLSGEVSYLRRVIFDVYFRILNPKAEHVRQFERYLKELQLFWPYERHSCLLSGERPYKDSARYLWSRNNAKVLDIMRYDRHLWLRDREPKFSLDSIFGEPFTQQLQYLRHEKDKNTLGETERIALLKLIFSHYLFVKSRPTLCGHKNLPIPIVEVGMSPLGEDMPDVRIDNLFRKRSKATLKTLLHDFPPLSREVESLLHSIIKECDRSMGRLYKWSCNGAYTMDPKTNQFEVSSLCRML